MGHPVNEWNESLDINIVPEDEVSLRVMRDDLGRGVANEGGGQQQRDDLGGENLSAAVALELRHSSGELWVFLFMGPASASKSDTSRSLVS